ncbi:hypothetical protein MYX65_09665 [Acidobacteria bacterium AH-259-L09]|nr:hypothetical protein [Acidobacteria bacterium AH-259-L09]
MMPCKATKTISLQLDAYEKLKARAALIVVDASIILEVLLRTPPAPEVEERIFAEDVTLHAPHLIDLGGPGAPAVRPLGGNDRRSRPISLNRSNRLPLEPLSPRPVSPAHLATSKQRHSLRCGLPGLG